MEDNIEATERDYNYGSSSSPAPRKISIQEQDNLETDSTGVLFWLDEDEDLSAGIRGTSKEPSQPRRSESNIKNGSEASRDSGRVSHVSGRSFIKGHGGESGELGPGTRQRLMKTLNSSKSESVIGAMILFNFILICIETDSRALEPGSVVASENAVPPHWVIVSQVVLFAIFTIELFLRIYGEQARFHKKTWNLLDTFIILAGAVEYTLQFAGTKMGTLTLVRVVRLCRLLRLMRVLHLFSILKELKRLLQMMGSCFKTLFWSFLLLVLVMTIWAIVAVELVNPVVQEIAASDSEVWEGCGRCSRSFSTVFHANITFFQTVVAGDSWGLLAIPVIEARPLTAVVFVGALLTLVFGVLNLIVAVIVDTFAENREKDIHALAKDLEAEEKEQKKMLGRIFDKIDIDKSGGLSYEEIQDGASRVQEFANWLRVLDIDSRDLLELFKIVDEDGNGEIEPEEFIEAMYRLKTGDPKTATTLIKHIVMRLEEKSDQNQVEAKIQDRLIRHERQMRDTVELALYKASEVAMQAAIQAAREMMIPSTGIDPMVSGIPPESPSRPSVGTIPHDHSARMTKGSSLKAPVAPPSPSRINYESYGSVTSSVEPDTARLPSVPRRREGQSPPPPSSTSAASLSLRTWGAPAQQATQNSLPPLHLSASEGSRSITSSQVPQPTWGAQSDLVYGLPRDC